MFFGMFLIGLFCFVIMKVWVFWFVVYFFIFLEKMVMVFGENEGFLCCWLFVKVWLVLVVSSIKVIVIEYKNVFIFFFV